MPSIKFKLGKTFEDRIINLALIIFVTATFIASFWNVDALHEGALFPSAVGISDGLSIFREVNNQYGFVVPLLNAPWLAIFGPYLVVSRIFSFFIVCLIAYMLYLNAQLFSSKATAKLAVLLWIGISPGWSFVFTGNSFSGGTWPNHFGILLVLFMMYLLFRNPYPPSTTSIFAAGALCFLSSQARIEFTAVWVLCTLVIVITQKKLRLNWILGSIFSGLSTFLYLFLNGSVKDWLEQTLLVWTMNAPGHELTGEVTVLGLGFFISNGLNFILLASIVICLGYLDYSLLRKYLRVELRIVAVTTILIFIASIEEIIPKTIPIAGKDLSPYLTFAIHRSLFSYINVAILISLWIIISQLYIHKKNRTLKSKFFLDFQNLILIACCIGVFGIFHNINADYRSITIAPFILLILKNSGESYMQYFQPFQTTFRNIVAPSLLITSLLIFVFQIQQDSYQYASSTLRGLHTHIEGNRDSLDSQFAIVQKYTTPGRTYMNCQTGLLTVGPSGFIGADKWSWNYQPPEMLEGRFTNLRTGDSIITCQMNTGDKKLLGKLTNLGKISIVASYADLVIYYVN